MSEAFESHSFDDSTFERPPTKSKAQARAERRAERASKQAEHRAPPLVPKTENQREYIEILRDANSCIALGPAGTGKTYIAARIAAQRKMAGHVDKIIITRVNVSKREHALGFLPGNIDAKMKPWMTPVVEGLRAEVSAKVMDTWKAAGEFEIVPFEFMRGRTFDNAFVILDEAQNASFDDLELFVTRTGQGSQVVICGDPGQIDIPNSGLEIITDIAEENGIVDTIEFTEEDVVRSAEAKAWVKGIAKYKRAKAAAGGDARNLDGVNRFIHSGN
ncbi:PhoH-like phosphate starvation-inducible [Caulobacter phage CcrColossus]|uniref:PhoH-like protein n=1 Tax=Caulobacter phage CcrColossus TaxID=1211640 RepID=K4JRN3_9CAUD|nr:PhoH-like phosphate starvation-inducible [Caulobacter phage CcrColossus]AFU87979.1 putative PhoH-like protein [Caulobacter phage CcrColossus]